MSSSSRYSSSNPESGIFSASDYDQSENRFIKYQQSYNNSNNNMEVKKSGKFRSIIFTFCKFQSFILNQTFFTTTKKVPLANKVSNQNNFNSNNNNLNNNNLEYNPLSGVSFKQTHSSDVEIVGIKLGNQNNYDYSSNFNNQNNNLAIKKKNSLKSIF